MKTDPQTIRWRVPRRDDPFLVANASRMYELLVAVDSYPPGVALKDDVRQAIQGFFGDAYQDGIDIIAVSEGGFTDEPSAPESQNEH